ncbi:TIGR03668 family PPOX class F420-dependent oxidoreductase [Haloarchaeobius amylolyticus]|uniref:TIGR03668 family PPOX class F420-dependent oxidoreductase n=1 Tax=Haloarchaeobius amylolyticus TaxID=1198296 RepID=UPI0022706557|nr:TIGR03668 family PPOX class F420-dependent oxidoreductase [Haloarchaeobius amylolyticus]
MFQEAERRYLETARVGRLATADARGRPSAIPVCFALVDGTVVTPIDEKPQRVAPGALRRSRDISENPYVTLVVDHYTEDWGRLGWVQVRGTASHCAPDDDSHSAGVVALREKYEQYTEHALENRPLIRISPGSVRSWGDLERPGESSEST